MRTTKEYLLNDPADFKLRLLTWSRQFDEIVWLDSNDYPQKSTGFEAVLAAQAFTTIKTDYLNAFDKLKEYQEVTADWIFGYLSYDLKNDVEELSSNNFDGLHFPDLFFFQPTKLILIKKGIAVFHYLKMADDEIEDDFFEILGTEERGERKDGMALSTSLSETSSHKPETLNNISARISKEEYLVKVKKMMEHIHRGDIYEANFCQEFYAEDLKIDPPAVFEKLNDLSFSPFAVYLKFEEKYLLSASPERYLKKEGDKISSQPIKGTARRAEDTEKDKEISLALAKDPKERAENIMIVDLVRNDLSRIAKKGSVQVEELCEVYTFKQVHQLISTISAEVDQGIPPVEVLRSTFPMGSMTGAPKISAMKIIEELEETKRGLYSGAVGYFTPGGNFDFNVVIRSILYNAKSKYVSFSVGGAITSKSIPEKEYEECLLKAKAMKQALQS